MEFANVKPSGGSSGAWISVSKGSDYIGLSADFVEEMNAEDGNRMVLAFTQRDGEYNPWVGLISEEHSTVAPRIQIKDYDGQSSTTRKVQSSRLANELEPYTQNEDERIHLLLSPETKLVEHPDAEVKVHMHRLIPPEGASYSA